MAAFITISIYYHHILYPGTRILFKRDFFFPKGDGTAVHGVSLCLKYALSPTPKTYHQVLHVPATAFAVKVNYKDSCRIPDTYKYLVILGFPAEPNQRYCLLKSYCLRSEKQGQVALE